MIQGVFFFSYFGGPLQYYHFSGMIYPKEEGDGQSLTGKLTDDFGCSTLSEIDIREEEITFTKKYKYRCDLIHYQMKPNHSFQNLWVGTYKGIAVGRDHFNCLIVEVPMKFLLPMLAQKT